MFESIFKKILARFIVSFEYFAEKTNPAFRSFGKLTTGDIVIVYYGGPQSSNCAYKLLRLSTTKELGYKLYRNFQVHGMVLEIETKLIESPYISNNFKKEMTIKVLVNDAYIEISDLDFFSGVSIRKILP